jgi:hypothetical protein
VFDGVKELVAGFFIVTLLLGATTVVDELTDRHLVPSYYYGPQY